MGKKSGPSPPPAPNPYEMAAAEAQYNRINQFTPFGNLIFTNPGQAATPGPQAGFVQGGLSPTAQGLLPQQGSKGSSGQLTPITPPGQPGAIPPGLMGGKGGGGQPPAAGQFAGLGPMPFGGAGSFPAALGGAGTNASATATLQLNPAIQFLENLRMTSDANLMADALGRQGALNPNPIDLSGFAPIQSELDLTGIDFTTPENLGALSSPTLGGINTQGLPGIPTDINRYRGDVESAFFERGRSLLDPALGDQERSLRQRLATRGLPESGEAFDRDMTRFLDARNRAYTDLARQSVLTGGQEASRGLADILAAQGQGFGQRAAISQAANQAALGTFGAGMDVRNQLFSEALQGNAAAAQRLALQQQLLGNRNAARQMGLNESAALRQNQFNELASLMGLQQVQAPTFQNFFGPGQVDVMGAFGLQQQAQQAAFQAQSQRQNAMLGGLFGLGSAALLGPFG